MSIKDRLAAKSAMIGSTPKTTKPVEEGPTRPKTAPGQLMSSLPFLAEKERELREMVQENETLREQLKNGTATEVTLEELHEVPGRRRKLTAEQYAELKENLRRNLLVQAITVRKRAAGGGFEIVSGHNRVAIYKELGRDRIPAVFLQGADDYVTEASALYANLFQPDLTDFEKYLGFKKLLEQTGKTQKELAADSGADEKSVSRWMSFGDLPDGALQIIEASPACIGGTAVMALAAIARDGKADAVISAIKAIADGAVTQEAGVRMAKESKVATPKPARPTPVTIRQGKSVYCKVIGARQSLRIDFQSEEARIAAEQAIHAVLTEFAAPKK